MNSYGGIMKWLAYEIFVKRPEDIERLILSLVKELKGEFLKDGLIDTYHFLRHVKEGKYWVVFRLGKEKDIDDKTIDTKVREKRNEYDFIDEIGTTSPIDDELLAKVLFSLSEISMTILENKDKLNKDAQADECVHYFLNQLGYNYLKEIDLYSNWELERFRVLLEKNPKKLQGIIKIHERKIKEMRSVLK